MSAAMRLKTQEAVDRLVASVDTCNVALLTDSSTGLILCTSSDSAMPQNALERFADDMKADLAYPYIDAAVEVAECKTVSSTRIDADGWVIALRAMPSGEDILICRCDDAPDRAALNEAAAAVFELMTPAEDE